MIIQCMNSQYTLLVWNWRAVVVLKDHIFMEQCEHYSNFHLMCSAEERNSYMFGTIGA